MSRETYERSAIDAAIAAGVDPDLFLAVIQQESAWNPDAVSPVGAVGLTQIMPATARDPGFGVAPIHDLSDTKEQLRFGAQYLAAMLDRYDGDVRRGLAAYNAGAGTVDRAGGVPNIAETQDYVASITGNLGGRGGASVRGRPAGLGDGVSRSSRRGAGLGDRLARPVPGFVRRGNEFLEDRLGIDTSRQGRSSGDFLIEQGMRLMTEGF